MTNWTNALLTPAIAACLLTAPAIAAGTTAWRCGNSYSDRPCEGGKPLAVDDARDAAQQRDANRATHEAQAAGKRMERDRLVQEKAALATRPTLIDSRRSASTTQKTETVADGASRKKKGKKEPDYFSARDPAATAKKKTEKAAKKSDKATARSGASG
ncbi:hypothetical protein GCM10023165_14420 [Variovorax defluvii]|uniref:DUF4124 domain-containing protein n=1 Tax=Variovorax defluvii TaxID=913761 RepID=A0ABP8HAZ1_9BURK